ncbi:DeoR family transcriptional regulator, partial [Agromyces soli]
MGVELAAEASDARRDAPDARRDASERRELARALVEARGFVSVADLAGSFGVTSVTARADLDALERDGLVRRVHGGAVPAGDQPRPAREPSLEEALETSVAPKQRIGALAASLVQSGQSLIVDVGSTCLQLAPARRPRPPPGGPPELTKRGAIARQHAPHEPPLAGEV